MKCQYCGKDLAEGAKFCDGCGSKVEAQPVYQDYGYNNNNEPKKGNNGLKLTIIILIVIILILVGFGVWYFLIKGDGDNGGKEEQNVVTDNKKEEKPNVPTLSCKGYDSSGVYEETVLEFNASGTTINKVTAEMSQYVDPEEYDEETIEYMKSSICSMFSYETCDAKLYSDNKFVFKIVTTDLSAFTQLKNYHSIDEAKAGLEESGLTCTRN